MEDCLGGKSMLFILLFIVYIGLKERDWQKECYKERGKKCGGLYGGDNTTGYMADMCIDCPYRGRDKSADNRGRF